jgi:hypothetical protein
MPGSGPKNVGLDKLGAVWRSMITPTGNLLQGRSGICGRTSQWVFRAWHADFIFMRCEA